MLPTNFFQHDGVGVGARQELFDLPQMQIALAPHIEGGDAQEPRGAVRRLGRYPGKARDQNGERHGEKRRARHDQHRVAQDEARQNQDEQACREQRQPIAHDVESRIGPGKNAGREGCRGEQATCDDGGFDEF